MLRIIGTNLALIFPNKLCYSLYKVWSKVIYSFVINRLKASISAYGALPQTPANHAQHGRNIFAIYYFGIASYR